MAFQKHSSAAAKPHPAASSGKKLCLVDVGGAGGLKRSWHPFFPQIFPVTFEPNPNDAAALRIDLRENFEEFLVLEMGLADVGGPQTLNIARSPKCSSLRKPNEAVLSRYRIGKLFQTVSSLSVECARYEDLFKDGKAPAPDAIKIDVQGFEYEVLQGFGRLLDGCLGIELETHLYEVYHGQRLMHDLIALLAGFGFVLRRIHPKPNFDGDVVELDVFFTKDIAAWRAMKQPQKEKFSIISEAWKLTDYAAIDPSEPHNHRATIRGERNANKPT